MKVLNLLNSIVFEIEKNSEKYYFLLDSGFGYSFSIYLDSINNNDFNLDKIKFELDLRNEEIELKGLSDIFGVNLSGILGIDFFHKFDNILIDFNQKEVKFNLDTFNADFEINLVYKNPFIINISLENSSNKEESCLVDTGAFQCMYFTKKLEKNYLVGKNWRFPSAMGPMSIDYFKDVPLYFDNILKGSYIFGKSSNLPPMPFSYVLGLNFMSDYICFFDLKNNKIKFKKISQEKLLNTQALFSLCFQINLINGEIIVSNKLEGCNSEININDKIIIPNLDMNNIEVINQIYNKLIFLNNESEIELIFNRKKVFLKPVMLFR